MQERIEIPGALLVVGEVKLKDYENIRSFKKRA